MPKFSLIIFYGIEVTPQNLWKLFKGRRKRKEAKYVTPQLQVSSWDEKEFAELPDTKFQTWHVEQHLDSL